MRVIVIGCGLAGIASAYFLREAGARVTVLDRADGPGLGTSYANGALLHPSLVEPWNSPGILWNLLRWIGRENSPMLVRAAALPSLLVWGLRFIRGSNPERFKLSTRRNLALAQYSLEMMRLIRADTRIDYDQSFRGLVALFRSAAAFTRGRASAQTLAAQGVPHIELDVEHLLALEPTLRPIAGALAGAIHFTADEGGDAYRFCAELMRVAVRRGVQFRFGTDVQRLERRCSRLARLWTREGTPLEADRYVLAAGSYSAPLARTAGLDIPVRPAKGYSITLPRAGSPTAPQVPVIDLELHAAVIPVGAERIRVAGTAELAGFDLSIQPPRIENLLALLGQSFPDYAATIDRSKIQPWAGLRPMSADGVPLIGATRLENLYLNTGHGHLGWTLAAGSGKLLADLLVGCKPALPAEGYDPGRF